VIKNIRKRVQTGKLVVKKWVDWNGFEPEPVQFEICLVGPAPETTTQCQSIDGTGTLVFDGLVPGSYTVTEDPGPGWEVTILGSPVEIHRHHKDCTETVKVKNRRVQQSGGRLDVVKIASWNGETPQDVSFTICVAGAAPECRTASFQAQDFVDGVGQATLSWPGLEAGEYVISEDPGPGWAVEIVPASVTVVEGETVTGTVTNTRLRGRLEVTKVVDSGTPPDPGQSFEICLTGPAPSPAVQCQSVGAEGGPLAFESLVAGEYTVTETDPGAEWTVSIAPEGGVVVVPAGGQGSATVTNSRLATGSIIVRKVTVPADDTESVFTFNASWQAASFTLRNGESQSSGPLAPGTYSVSELQAPGWATESSCSDGSPASAIDLGAGETVTCTFTNSSGSVEVTKTVVWNGPDLGPVTFEICLALPDVPQARSCQLVEIPQGQTQGTLVWRAPPGDYVVTETDPGFEWGVEIPQPLVTVTAGETATAEVFNVRSES
jgi:hypothetical protein